VVKYFEYLDLASWTAFDAIQAVHGDGDMPDIDMTVKPRLRSTHGGYVHYGHVAKSIELKPGLKNSAFAITHEIGHFIDHQGLGTAGRGFSSRGDSEDASAVMAAIRASK
jgi:hypothetical protein